MSPDPWSPVSWWREEDSNLRSSQGAADLQSAAINHSAISPKQNVWAEFAANDILELAKGLEPPTR
jgi:hypothetical protein